MASSASVLPSCPLCGGQRELLVHETWAGTLHSACNHGACEDCLAHWVAACAKQPRLATRTPCFAECCPKVLPQRLKSHATRKLSGPIPEWLLDRARVMAKIAEKKAFVPDPAIWDITMELARLRNAAAHWGVSLISDSRGRQCMRNKDQHCPHCLEPQVALLLNPSCGHAACAGCWAQRVEGQLLGEQMEHKVCAQCYNPECTEVISWGLVRGICATYSKAVRLHVTATDVDFRAQERRMRCEVCGERAYTFRENPACGHVACEDCWAHSAETQIAAGLAARVQVSCLGQCCSKPVVGGLWSRLCQRSETVRGFHEDNMSERATIEAARRARIQLELPPELASPFQLEVPGPICIQCGMSTWGLLVNGCGHKACWRCWVRKLEVATPICLEERRALMSCFSPCCKAAVAPNLWAFLFPRSPILGTHNTELQQQVKLAKHVASIGVRLQWKPATVQVGPTCVICHERHWSLLTNSVCGHGACHDCWGTWAASEIPRCEAERRDVGRCFAPNCEERLELPLVKYLETRSEPLQAFGCRHEVKERRRLRCNALYPAQMQQDCPKPGCWGLGYLGFDSVMCFICEQRWSPEEGGIPIPVDIDVEEIMGVKVKKCPKCQEHIEKNGGCDHMTCRCGHEFLWTTLAPYKR